MRRSSYCHRGGDRPLTGVPTHAFLRDVAARFPSRDAVVSIPQQLRLTYAELFQGADRLAKGLVALGIGRGTRVGVWATDNVEWVLLQVATARVGAVLVNVNPANRGTELAHALHAARVQALFLMPSFRSSDYVGMLRDQCPEADERAAEEFACAALPDLRTLVVYDPDTAEPAKRPAPGFHTWEDVLARGEDVPDRELERRAGVLDADDPVNIQFTSGTTGFPKPVVLTHHNILNNALFTAEVLGFTEADRLCVPVPFYHCFGMVVSNLAVPERGRGDRDPGAALRGRRDAGVPSSPGALHRPARRADDVRRGCSSDPTSATTTCRAYARASWPAPRAPGADARVIEDMGCQARS